MVARFLAVMTVLCATAAAMGSAAEEAKYEQRRFTDCFLYEGAGGHVWASQPLVSLGMIGVGPAPPVRLSPTLAEKYRPLVSQLDKAPDVPDFWYWAFPRARGQQPIILLHLEAKTQEGGGPVSGGEKKESYRGGTPREIVECRLICAEFVWPSWRAAWDRLNEGLKQIVAVSRTAPVAERRRRLAEVIETSSRALSEMTKTRVDEQFREILGKIEPTARVVRIYQRRIEAEWGGHLRQYVATLRIAPRTPLPPEPKKCPVVELLARSGSAEELLATIKRSWPEETLEEPLIYSKALKRTVFVWQVTDLTPAEFETLRGEAKEQLERLGRNARAEQPPQPSGESPQTIPQFGVVLRPAGADLLAEKCILGGTLVDRLLPEGPGIGLQAGDVIIDYWDGYDLAMHRFPTLYAMTQLRRVARQGGELKVLRGERIVTLDAKGG
jgi:hypothetical protein